MITFAYLYQARTAAEGRGGPNVCLIYNKIHTFGHFYMLRLASVYLNQSEMKKYLCLSHWFLMHYHDEHINYFNPHKTHTNVQWLTGEKSMLLHWTYGVPMAFPGTPRRISTCMTLLCTMVNPPFDVLRGSCHVQYAEKKNSHRIIVFVGI